VTSPRLPQDIETKIADTTSKGASFLEAILRLGCSLLLASSTCEVVTAEAVRPVHFTRAEYARRSNVSEATVSRWLAEGLPTIPVGTTVRIDPEAADDWRRARGRKPTKAKTAASDLDVSAELGNAGLRVVGAGGRGAR
jgi:hypothetical protein